MTVKKVFPGFYLFKDTLKATVEKYKRQEAHRDHIRALIAYLRRGNEPEEKRDELLLNLMRAGKIAAAGTERVSLEMEENIREHYTDLDSGDLDGWACLFARMLDESDVSDEATYVREAKLLHREELLAISPFRGRVLMLVSCSVKEQRPVLYGEIMEVMLAMAGHHHTRTIPVSEDIFLVTAVTTLAGKDHLS